MTDDDLERAAQTLLKALKAQEHAMTRSDWQAFAWANGEVNRALSMMTPLRQQLGKEETVRVKVLLADCQTTLDTSLAALRQQVDLHAQPLRHAKRQAPGSGRIIDREG